MRRHGIHPHPQVLPWTELSGNRPSINIWAWLCPICGGFGGWEALTRSDARKQGYVHVSRCVDSPNGQGFILE